MSANTKIVVLRSKELVYSIVLLIVSILIIMVAVSIFVPERQGQTKTPIPVGTTESDETGSASPTYVPGIYTGILQLGSSNVELQMTVDNDHINSITFTNIDDAVATMYPLMQPTLSELSKVIISDQSLENVSYAEENRYTSMLLLQTISDLIEKARASENADSPALPDTSNMQ